MENQIEDYYKLKSLGVIGEIINLCSIVGLFAAFFLVFRISFTLKEDILTPETELREILLYGLLIFSLMQLNIASASVCHFASSPKQFFVRKGSDFNFLWVTWLLLTVIPPSFVVLLTEASWHEARLYKAITYDFFLDHLWIAISSTIFSGLLLLLVMKYKIWMKAHGLI